MEFEKGAELQKAYNAKEFTVLPLKKVYIFSIKILLVHFIFNAKFNLKSEQKRKQKRRLKNVR